MWGPPLDNFHNFPAFHLNGANLSEINKAGRWGHSVSATWVVVVSFIGGDMEAQGRTCQVYSLKAEREQASDSSLDSGLHYLSFVILHFRLSPVCPTCSVNKQPISSYWMPAVCQVSRWVLCS